MAFPKDFIWGAATASYQIEGAALEDGRGECIWTRFSHTPGKVLNGDTGDVACDHYHLYPEDVALMRDLGIGAYRFSISWPRVIPAGTGALNPAGLDFYDRLVDAICAAGITPWVTLYHWDLPQALQDRGGWTNPEIIGWFADYTDVVTRRLGDRVQNWFTHNEPFCTAFLGHLWGAHAPGLTDPQAAFRAAHHALIAHGEAVPVIRRNVPGAKAGIVLNPSPQVSATDHPEDVRLAQRGDAMTNRLFLDAVFKGQYPADLIEFAGALTDGIDLSAVQKASVKCDFLGINYYMRWVIAHVPGKPDEQTYAFPPDAEFTAMGWEIYPQGLTDMLTRIHREYGPIDLYITENGAAFDDPEPTNGVVEDPRRVAFLRGYLAAAEAAIAQGVPLKGYFVWSLLDNFEWGYGYSKRFGIYHVDFQTQKRTPKQSALFYKRLIAGQETLG